MGHEKIKARARALKRRVKDLEARLEDLEEWRQTIGDIQIIPKALSPVDIMNTPLGSKKGKPAAPAYGFKNDTDLTLPNVDNIKLTVGGIKETEDGLIKEGIKALEKEKKNEPDEKRSTKKVPARRKTATRKRVRSKDTEGEKVAETC